MNKIREKLYIHAVNIGSGGGLILLKQLLLSLIKSKSPFFLQVDSRSKLDEISSGCYASIKYVNPNIISRLQSELVLFNNHKKYTKLLFFGNLPPLLKLKGEVFVFIQNRYLVDGRSLTEFNIKEKIRITIERIWLKYRSQPNYIYIVQSKIMRELIIKNICSDNTILIRPFFDLSLKKDKNPASKTYDFIYIASGEPHKNHMNLIKAWNILAEKGFYPSLCLTLDSDLFLCKYADIINNKTRIINIGPVDNSVVFKLYAMSNALIYPSKFESFGLPLLEAKFINLPILASELDYVRDSVFPHETFDPNSSLSIARAVMRFIGAEDKLQHIMTADDFSEILLK
jgi:glycosyltransferase involved in cell wall biosynthesis